MAGVKKVKCPYCKKKSTKKGNSYWPFCSERCKLMDLGKWASGQYSIPGEPVNKENLKGEEKEDDDVD